MNQISYIRVFKFKPLDNVEFYKVYDATPLGVNQKGIADPKGEGGKNMTI